MTDTVPTVFISNAVDCRFSRLPKNVLSLSWEVDDGRSNDSTSSQRHSTLKLIAVILFTLYIYYRYYVIIKSL